jgi:hypothetical protein
VILDHWYDMSTVNSCIVNNILYAILYDMCIANNILYAILYDMSTVNSCIVNNILYAILYDLLNIASDSRSLLRINNTDNEMNNHGDSRALRHIKIIQKSDNEMKLYCKQLFLHNIVWYVYCKQYFVRNIVWYVYSKQLYCITLFCPQYCMIWLF